MYLGKARGNVLLHVFGGTQFTILLKLSRAGENDLCDILRRLNIVDKWYVLGVMLRVPPSYLNGVLQENPTVQLRLIAVLTYWLCSGDATQADLVKALNSGVVGESKLASEIATARL